MLIMRLFMHNRTPSAQHELNEKIQALFKNLSGKLFTAYIEYIATLQGNENQNDLLEKFWQGVGCHYDECSSCIGTLVNDYKLTIDAQKQLRRQFEEDNKQIYHRFDTLLIQYFNELQHSLKQTENMVASFQLIFDEGATRVPVKSNELFSPVKQGPVPRRFFSPINRNANQSVPQPPKDTSCQDAKEKLHEAIITAKMQLIAHDLTINGSGVDGLLSSFYMDCGNPMGHLVEQYDSSSELQSIVHETVERLQQEIQSIWPDQDFTCRFAELKTQILASFEVPAKILNEVHHLQNKKRVSESKDDSPSLDKLNTQNALLLEAYNTIDEVIPGILRTFEQQILEHQEAMPLYRKRVF